VLKKSFLFNLVLIALVTVGLLLLFFTSLNWLTNHGKQIAVPKLMGKNMSVAVKELEHMGFRIEIDSTYKQGKTPLEVLFQEPEAGTSVKIGRTIFITVNRKTPPSIEMPNLVNMSFRNAMLTMHSYNLEIGDTNYRPDVAAGAVLEQLLDGIQIAPGTMVPFGTRIDLVVGEGLSGEQEVPNLIGMNWIVAKTLLDSLMLTTNAIWEGKITDSASAIIYMQQPEALNELDYKNSIPEGDIVDIRIMQSPSQELLDKNQPGSKKLIGDEDSLGTTSDDFVNSPAPQPRKDTPDSTKRRKPLKGLNVHGLKDEEEDKKKSKGSNTKKTSSDVKGVGKPKTTAPAKPKVPAKPAPPKNDNSNSPADDYN